jgi:hypothetical protein
MPTNTDDKSREQAANDAANRDEQAANGGEPFAAQWLAVAEVADLLGVTPRTIQKRCKAGKLDARSVKTPTGDQWEINGASVEGGRTEATNEAANRATNSDEQAANSSQPQGDGNREQGAGRDDASPDFRAKYIAQIEDENRFLKLQLEAAMQSEAQTKAALREALRAMPKQLEAGTPEPPEAAPIARANNVPSATPSGPQKPAQRDHPLTIGDIADELERTLNR